MPVLAEPKTRRAPRLSTDVVVPLILLAGFAAVPVAAGGEQSYLVSLFMRIMIFAIAAVGLDFILGYGGLISFGHAAFIGLGAYAVGILAAHDIHQSSVALAVALARRRCSPSSPASSPAHQGRLFHHDHARVRADGVFHRPARSRPMAAMTA